MVPSRKHETQMFPQKNFPMNAWMTHPRLFRYGLALLAAGGIAASASAQTIGVALDDPDVADPARAAAVARILAAEVDAGVVIAADFYDNPALTFYSLIGLLLLWPAIRGWPMCEGGWSAPWPNSVRIRETRFSTRRT